jgi:hypothetical protein
MNERTFEVMPVNMLWALREKIDATLTSKLLSEQQELERRLARLTGAQQKTPRPYPQVHPKYFQSRKPFAEMAAPRASTKVVTAQLELGRTTEDLLCQASVQWPLELSDADKMSERINQRASLRVVV